MISRISSTPGPPSLCLCLTFAGFGGAMPAQGQEQTSGSTSEQKGLAEVVVSAQRRTEDLQIVPIAITAISAAQLQSAAATDALDVVQFVPNMFGVNNTGLGTANAYSIRGLSNTESLATVDAPVGTYADEVFVARQNANNLSLFDVDHVEVLRGPQGTLFGRNTTGGAVSIIYRKPAPELDGYVEAGFGEYSERFFRASVNVPLSATFLTKVSGFYIKDDGYVSNLTTGQTLNGNSDKGIRLAVRWLPSAAVTWDLAADYIDQEALNILNYPDSNNHRVSMTGLNTDFSWYPAVYSGPKSNYPLENQIYSNSITSNLAWTTGIGTINFITGWRDLRQNFFIDFFDSPLPVQQDAGPNGGQFVIANEGRHTQFSQEIKLNGVALDQRLTYVTGLYYLDEMNTTDLGQGFFLPNGNVPDGFCQPDTVPVCSIPTATAGQYVTSVVPFFYDRVLYNTTHSLAIYGQGDYKLTDPLTLTLGGRFTQETKSIEYTSHSNPYAAAINQFNTADMIAAGIPTKQTADVFTPRVALRYDFNPDVNMYVSATRGFKGGGWNARSSTAALTLPFSPETTWSYELGMRSEWLDHRVRANLTGFYSDTSDYQLISAYVLPGGGGDVFITGNYAGLEVYGVEAELAAAPIEGLTLFANLGWQQGKYKDLSSSVADQQQRCLAQLAAGGTVAGGTAPDCGNGIITQSGSIAEPFYLPRHSIKAGVSYVIRLGAVSLTPSASLENLGAYEMETANLPGSFVDGYTTWSAGLELSGGGARQSWRVSANCSNCSNRAVQAAELPPTVYYQDPRRWSVRFQYKF